MKGGGVGGGERGALHEVAAGIGHAQRLVECQVVNRLGVAFAMRIGGEVPGHVLDQLTRVRADRGSEQDGGQIRSPAPERRNGVARAHAEKARHDDDARVRERGQEAHRTHARAREAVSHEARLMDVERYRPYAGLLEMQREEGDGTQFAGGPQQIQAVAAVVVDVADDRRGFGEQRVRGSVPGRHDDDEAFVRIVLETVAQEARGRRIRRVVAEDGSTQLEVPT